MTVTTYVNSAVHGYACANQKRTTKNTTVLIAKLFSSFRLPNLCPFSATLYHFPESSEELRRGQRARAEERQHMQEVFQKLHHGRMLYDQRERDMEPVRRAGREEQRTLELERDLLNIIEGACQTESMDEFLDKKKFLLCERHRELDQKKKVLDKLKREGRWEEDDVWRLQRDQQRQRVKLPEAGPRILWESLEVSRWCEQQLRTLFLALAVDGLRPSTSAAVGAVSLASESCSMKADHDASNQGSLLMQTRRGMGRSNEGC